MRTKFDVRITQHKATKSDSRFVTITFYEGLENLIGTNYVKLKVENSRLYFIPSEKKVKGSLKLNRSVYAQKNFSALVEFVGEYPIDYDSSNNTYYVDMNKKQEVSITYANNRVPHPNYKAHKNEPYENEEEPVVETPIITAQTEVPTSIIDTMWIKSDPKIEVYNSLLKLLDSQIYNKEYKNAVFTAQTIHNMLEREEDK